MIEAKTPGCWIKNKLFDQKGNSLNPSYQLPPQKRQFPKSTLLTTRIQAQEDIQVKAHTAAILSVKGDAVLVHNLCDADARLLVSLVKRKHIPQCCGKAEREGAEDCERNWAGVCAETCE